MLNTSLREHCVQRIRDNQTDGASEIAREALALVGEYAREARADGIDDLRAELERLVGELRAVRPGMAPIDNLLGHWQRSVTESHTDSLDQLRTGAATAAEYWAQQSLAAVERVALHASALVEPGDVILTHSLSSTVGAVFRKLKGRDVHAIVTESSPGREGRRLAAQLSALGIATEFIGDAQIGLFAARANLALVGADSVLADGAVLNKAGTYLLALAAQDNDCPLIVCSESFKCRPQTADAVALEEAPADPSQAPDLPGVRARYFPLDLTPAALVSAWVDEEGVSLVYPDADRS